MKLNKKNLLFTGNVNTDSKSKRVLRALKNPEIKPIDIIQYFNSRIGKVSPITLQRERSAIKNLIVFNLTFTGSKLEKIYEWENIFKNIKIRVPKKKIEHQVLNTQQIDDLVQKLISAGKIEQSILLIACQASGLRPCEIRSIKLRDCIKTKSIETIDGQELVLEYYKINVFATKTNTYYTSIWSIELFDLVNDFYKGIIYLFENPRTKQQYKHNAFYRRFKPIKKILDQRFYPYLLRHGFGTNHYIHTKDVYQGSLLMGHSPEIHLSSYVHTKVDVKTVLLINQFETIKEVKTRL